MSKTTSTELEVLVEISMKLDDLITLFSVQGKEKEEQIRLCNIFSVKVVR